MLWLIQKQRLSNSGEAGVLLVVFPSLFSGERSQLEKVATLLKKNSSNCMKCRLCYLLYSVAGTSVDG